MPRRSFIEDGLMNFMKMSDGMGFSMKFFYVYILQSISSPERFYTGFTENLEQRLIDHNQGKCPHTAKHKPWRIKTSIAITDRERALDFERYLKTQSGRAFTKKRL